MQKINNLFSKILRIPKVLVGVDSYIKTDLDIETHILGNNPTQWALISDLLDEDSIIYSFGIGNDISIDLSLINLLDAQVFAFDPTPETAEWVCKQKLPKHFVFNPIGLANYNGKAKFHPANNSISSTATMLEVTETKNNAYKVDVRALDSIMSEFGHNHINLLKLNIEGMEYDVIDYIASKNILPSQILVEFHHGFNNISIDKTRNTVKTLRDLAYKVFHVSSTGEKISFVQEHLIESVHTKENEFELINS